MLQPPQFAGSESVSVHVPAHFAKGELQTQAPSTQACAPAQVLAQAPQLRRSMLASTQTRSQSV